MRNFASILGMFLCCATAMAADLTGTWKLDLKKSKMRSADVTAETMKIEKIGTDSYRTAIELTYSSGKTVHAARDRVCDGKERAVSGADSAASGNETETCEIMPAGGRKIIQKRDGKVIVTIRSTVSANGETMSNTRSDPNGEDVMVFDRQK
jgi:hypothetical protein